MDTNQIQKLAEDGKWDELEKVLSDELSQDLTSEERGAVYVNLMSLYMDISNTLSQEYADSLKDIIESLQVLKKAERGAGDNMDMEMLRKNLE